MSFKRAGYRRLPRTSIARFSGAGVRRFCRFFTPGTRQQRRIRIVDSCGDAFSDGGANPPASTRLRSPSASFVQASWPRLPPACLPRSENPYREVCLAVAPPGARRTALACYPSTRELACHSTRGLAPPPGSTMFLGRYSIQPLSLEPSIAGRAEQKRRPWALRQ